MSATHVEELVDGYALDALEPAETARVRTHLPECAACLRTLARSHDLISALPLSLDGLSPRGSVKTALLAAAREDVGVRGASTDARPRRLLPFRMDAGSANPFLRWASVGMAVAFVVGLVGGVAGWALVLGDRLNKSNADLEKSRNNIETLVDSNHIIHLDATYIGAHVTAVLAAPQEATPALVVINDVPTATAGNGYYLWLFAYGATELGGVVSPDSRGDIVTTLQLDLSKYDRMELDLQPLNASAPGGDTVIAGALR